MKNSAILMFAALLVVSCGQDEPVQQAEPTPAQTPVRAPGPMSAPVTTSLQYDLPESWNRVQPESPMRLDQAVIPGDAGNGELAVFFFGPGGGGGTEANLRRWTNQMSSSEEPVRESFEVDELKVTWIDVSGTINPSSTGMGPSEPQPNSRMFAAVVEGEGGPWFFKATGPEQTMTGAREAFVGMLRSARLSRPVPPV